MDEEVSADTDLIVYNDVYYKKVQGQSGIPANPYWLEESLQANTKNSDVVVQNFHFYSRGGDVATVPDTKHNIDGIHQLSGVVG